MVIQRITYSNTISFKGKQVAEQGNEGADINPEGELQKGDMVKQFNQKPSDWKIRSAIKQNGGNPTYGWDTKKGKLLDDSLQTGRYDTQLL